MITILTNGSRGDTQPFIALGLALERAGQRVRIAAFENYRSLITGFGLEFYPVRGDVAQVAGSSDVQDAVRADNPLKILLSFNKLKSMIIDLQEDFFDACAGADAIVYHPGAPLGYFIGQHFGIPSIMASPFPMTPTGAFPSLVFYDSVRLGSAYNYITHKVFEQVLWSTSEGSVKRFWEKQFGQLPGNFGNPFPRQTTAELPALISCSPNVFPRPADWPRHVYMEGYWFLDELGGWQPPADLAAFLDNGAPPVYIGFGSIGDRRTAVPVTSLVVKALQQAGQRGILATGWNGMVDTGDLPDSVFLVESVPHDWLFPRVSAVVHHGGAGTTAAGLRAGVPAVIIPHGVDQFAWGRRLFELGVGAKPIQRKHLTVDRLSDALQFALRDDIRASAQALGSSIRGEQGADAAANVIINCIAQSRGAERE